MKYSERNLFVDIIRILFVRLKILVRLRTKDELEECRLLRYGPAAGLDDVVCIILPLHLHLPLHLQCQIGRAHV